MLSPQQGYHTVYGVESGDGVRDVNYDSSHNSSLQIAAFM
jgi:hypothetical protein